MLIIHNIIARYYNITLCVMCIELPTNICVFIDGVLSSSKVYVYYDYHVFIER